MELLPAIDIRGGRVVRLQQGDFDRETTYSDDPAEVARAFHRAGASWIHLVDLDGARGERPQTPLIASIVRALPAVNFQVAGGLRSEESVADMITAGAARAVVGTAAIADPDFAATLVARHGFERIVAALDVRDGQAVGEGWRKCAVGRPFEEAIETLAAAGVTHFAVTAIERDGLLQGPDLVLLGRAVALGRGAIVASGGVSSLEDLRAVMDLGCSGAIVGRAIYEGRFDVSVATRFLREESSRSFGDESS
jgi:phosphoribosylformimino-5-aminoimidazole carboxamide ribotide isomerase